MSAVKTATTNELIIENQRLTKFPLCIHYNNAIGCYKRIIREHVILNSHKFGIHDKFYRLHSIALD